MLQQAAAANAPSSSTAWPYVSQRAPRALPLVYQLVKGVHKARRRLGCRHKVLKEQGAGAAAPSCQAGRGIKGEHNRVWA